MAEVVFDTAECNVIDTVGVIFSIYHDLND